MKVHAREIPFVGEDAHFSHPLDHRLLFGVADGHAGGEAARLCTRRVCELVREHLASPEMWRTVFRRLSAECAEASPRSGCTITAVLLDCGTGAYECANVGDSHALHVTPTSHLWATTSHRLQDNAAERQRLREHVCFAHDGVALGPPRLYPGGLACSRSLGDADCPHVSCAPSVCSGVLGPHDALVVCSDGVWDHASTRRVAQVVRDTYNPEFVCRLAAPRSSDDITAVVATRQKVKTSMHTNLFRLFRKANSSSSLSSEEEASPTTFTIEL